MALEQPTYKVLSSERDFELRLYEPHIVAETVVDGDFGQAGKAGFRKLADYIFGNNRSPLNQESANRDSDAASRKIKMTAPVNMHREGERYRVTFMMPSLYTLDTLPEPVNSDVRLRQIPGELIAAIRYSGTWHRQRYETRRIELEEWVETRGWRPAGEPIFARYDPPFKPWFLRRNEILIPVTGEPRSTTEQGAS